MNDRGLFAITAASAVIRLGPDRRGTATFTVSNISGHAARGRARFVLLAGGDPGWFAVAGPADRDFSPGGTHQYAVQVRVPPDAPLGSCRFRLDMAALPDGDERSTPGPPVAFTVEASGVPAPVDGRGCIPWATVLRWLARRREVPTPPPTAPGGPMSMPASPLPSAEGEEPGAPAAVPTGPTALLGVVPKPVLVGLLAIVALFAAGLCLGLRTGDGGKVNLDAPGVELLKGLLTRRSSLALEDLTPNNPACLNGQQQRLIVTATCTYEVRSPARVTGRLTLQLDQGTELALTLEQEDVLTSKARIRTSQRTSLDVLKERARLTVACTRGAGVAACTLRVLP